MLVAPMLHAIPTCGQGCVRQLQRRVVGDVEPPVVMERIRTRRFDVAVSDSDEFRDLGAAGLVGFQPAELLPVF